MARRSMADLAAVPPMTATVPTLGEAPPRLRQVPVETVAPNPLNPRTETGDLADLESMKTAGQLQPCLVVTRSAFLAIHPEHEATIGTAAYVVVAGTRRRLAAEQFEIPTLDVVVRDAVAADRLTFFGVSILENVDRQQLSPLDEARAVQHLAAEAGHGGKSKAAEQLGKSAGWVTQRLVLLDLTPAMQARLRAGELPLHRARELGKLPADEQEDAWRRERPPAPEPAFTAVKPPAAADAADVARDTAPARPPKPVQVRLKVEASPEDIVEKMAGAFPREHLVAIVALLSARVAEED